MWNGRRKRYEEIFKKYSFKNVCRKNIVNKIVVYIYNLKNKKLSRY